MAKSKAKAKLRLKKQKRLIISALCLIGLTVISTWYFWPRMPRLPEPPLKDLAKAQGVDLGVLIKADRLDEKVYRDIAASQFAFVNIDGGLHFGEVQPAQGQYDFSEGDKIVEFAEANDMPIQLHHLVWGDDSRLPKWLVDGNFTEAQLKEILHDHITTIVEHYKGRVKEYTVVNEPFTESQGIYGLNDWFADRITNYEGLMDDYFIWARQADPDAKLIINDFYNETKNGVSDAMYDYVKVAKARGVPIDGVGVQLHVDASRPPEKQAMIDNFRRFGEIGAPVYITEFDVNTNTVKGDDAYKSQLESQITYDMARACIESKACVSFNVFGITRENQLKKKLFSHNSRDYMFDSRYQPRPSFDAFRQAWLE